MGDHCSHLRDRASDSTSGGVTVARCASGCTSSAWKHEVREGGKGLE